MESLGHGWLHSAAGPAAQHAGTHRHGAGKRHPPLPPPSLLCPLRSSALAFNARAPLGAAGRVICLMGSACSKLHAMHQHQHPAPRLEDRRALRALAPSQHAVQMPTHNGYRLMLDLARTGAHALCVCVCVRARVCIGHPATPQHVQHRVKVLKELLETEANYITDLVSARRRLVKRGICP